MARTGGNEYQTSQIGGNAAVHQGDNYNPTNYNFGSVNTVQIFAVEDSAPLLVVETALGKKRVRDHGESQDSRCDFSVKRRHCFTPGTSSDESPRYVIEQQRCPNVSLGDGVDGFVERAFSKTLTRPNSNNEEKGVRVINKILEAVGAQDERFSLPLSDEVEQELQEGEAIGRLQSDLSHRNEGQRSLFYGLIDKLRRNQYFPAIANILPRPRRRRDDDLLSWSGPGAILDIRPSSTAVTGPMQDLCATFFALVVVLTYSSGSAKDVKTIANFQESRKLPLLAGLIAFAVLRYLCFPQIAQCVSDMMGDCIILEDAFCNERRVPMSHCASFQMLKAYLGHHLAETTAEAFIEVGQFNLTLGKRGGPAIHSSDWADNGRIKANYRVVMAVYLKRGDARCMECHSELNMSDTGQFACHPCGRFYGNCATLKYWAVTNARVKAPAKSTSPSHHDDPRSRKPISSIRIQEVDEEEDDDDEFNIHGLRNIDFRILRRKRKVPSSRTSEATILPSSRATQERLESQTEAIQEKLSSLEIPSANEAINPAPIDPDKFRGLDPYAQKLLLLSTGAKRQSAAGDYSKACQYWHELLSQPGLDDYKYASHKFESLFLLASTSSSMGDLKTALSQAEDAVEFVLRVRGPSHMWYKDAQQLLSNLRAEEQRSHGLQGGQSTLPAQDIVVEAQLPHTAEYEHDNTYDGGLVEPVAPVHESHTSQSYVELEDLDTAADSQRGPSRESEPPVSTEDDTPITIHDFDSSQWQFDPFPPVPKSGTKDPPLTAASPSLSEISVGSWIKNDLMMTDTSEFSSRHTSSRQAFDSHNSSSYLPKNEADFMRDFECCGITHRDLHALLQHYEEVHAQRDAEPNQVDPQAFSPSKAAAELFLDPAKILRNGPNNLDEWLDEYW